MLLSLTWLKKYVNLPKNLTAKQLAHDLTMSTVEVEHVLDNSEKFERIVVGKIVEVKAHPNADKLKVVEVDIGNKKFEIRNPKSETNSKSKIKNKNNNLVQIVCGGTNLKTDMFVPVALPGSKVRWHGEGDLVELEETEIRGVKSFGMICGANEIGLENMFLCGEKEIVDLSNMVQDRVLNQHLKPGQSLGQVLGDQEIVLEIDNKSITHRPDLWNHYGVARELSVIYKTKLAHVIPSPEIIGTMGSRGKKTKRSRNEFGMTINILDKKLCPRYIGCLVKNVKVGPSPEWLAKSLEAVGLRSINNIVDITNFIMLDVGEPMHAFDKAKLYQMQIRNSKLEIRKNEKIELIIRRAKNGEKIKTLDEIERKLDDSILVIADIEKPIALAGIMGGVDSGVDNQTTEIILEAANFDAMNIRKTTQKLGIRSEASNRFEKKLASELAALGMTRALELIKEIIPGAKVETVVDVNYTRSQKNIIPVGHNFLEKRIGQKLTIKEVKNILEKLGFEVKSQKSKVKSKDFIYLIKVPYWRATGDIDCPEDIVEEIARIYGYDNFKGEKHQIEMDHAIWQQDYEIRKKIKHLLVLNGGFNEVFNYPWTEDNTLKKLGFGAKMIELSNPPAEANKRLAVSLIPNLIKNIADNLRYFDEFKIFELSRVFWPEFKKLDKRFKDVLPEQPHLIAGAVVNEKNKNVFLTTKGVVENIFDELRIKNYELRIKEPKFDYWENAKLLEIIVANKSIGWVGELKPEIYRQFDFKNKEVCFFEINVDELIIAGTGLDRSNKKYQPLPQFPGVIRDLAFEVSYQIKWAEVQKEILKQVQDDILESVEFLSEFDLGDRKSIAFRIVYQTNRTLTENEVEVVQNKIIKLMADKFGAKLRVSLKK